MTAKFIKYAQPLIMGEVEVPFENGVPAYVRLSKSASFGSFHLEDESTCPSGTLRKALRSEGFFIE